MTYLILDILQLVDGGKIALTPAVELSYLPENAQAVLLEEIHRNDCTPSLSQAVRLKKQYQAETLIAEGIWEIMQEEKANQQEKSASGRETCGNSSRKATLRRRCRKPF